jgi:hypothetical protein
VKRLQQAFLRERRQTVSDERENVDIDEAERVVSRVNKDATDEVEDDDFEGHELTVDRVLRNDEGDDDPEAGRVL